MALFNKIKNIFKKPKKETPKKEKVIEKERVKKIKEVAPKAAPVRKVQLKKKTGEVYKILKHPHISEKSTELFDEGKYTFRVFPRANKVEIKKAINDLYGVRVKDVKIINIKPKSRILKGLEGKKHGYKKAIIILEKGEKIEIIPH
jgi:large subunit ribosomal protein L23